MRRVLFLLLLLSAFHFINASGSIKGVVNDVQGPLPWANIIVTGTNNGTSSNLEGFFFITNIPDGSYEVFISYLGYQTEKIAVEISSNKTIDLGVITLKEDATVLGEIVIEGTMKHGQARAFMIQKNSDGIVNAIASDRIGKLPDRNAAEAVQRISGLSIERDQGEGRFVAVRGLPSEWSSTTINGNRIPTAEEETVSRATAFDFFPTDMIEYVIVSKAITPDMEADAMGGNVNFITKYAPDKRTLNLTLGGGYNQKAEGGIGSINLLYGDRTNDGKFGFLINGTYWTRKWATDNYEPRRGGDGLGIYRLELRDYSGTRTTIGFNATLDYKFDDNNRVFFKGMYGTLSDNELHYKHRLRFDKNRIELQNIHDELITRLFGGELSGVHKLSEMSKFEWKAAHYDNLFEYGDIPNGTDNSYYLTRFTQKNIGFVGLENRGAGNLAYNTIDGGTDEWDNISSHTPDGFTMNPDLMGFDYVELYKVYVNEKDNFIGQLDFTQNFTSDFIFKAGLKYRNKERIAKFSDEFYNWDPDAPIDAPTLGELTLTTQPGRDEYLSELDNPYSGLFSKVLEEETNDNFWDNYKQYLYLDEGESVLLSNGGALGRTFDLFENHFAGYLMGTYKVSPKLTIIGGMRATQTKLKVEGFTYLADTDALEPTTTEKDYLSILPMLHIRFSPEENINLRFAATRTYSRPDFGYLSPGGTWMEVDNTYISGNPDLDPTYSWNFDLMGEYFFGNVGVASAGLFYKYITDPIFESRTLGTYKGRDGVAFNRPLNGDDAYLFGVELGFSRNLDFLPGFLNGFGLEANYTVMTSEMTIPTGDGDRKTVIPRQADNLINAALYYEKSGFSARLALNFKDDYIMSHGDEPTFDEYYGKYTSMDFSTSYVVLDGFVIFAEINNLLNEPMVYYLGEKDRPTQVEFYGFRGQTGIRYSIF